MFLWPPAVSLSCSNVHTWKFASVKYIKGLFNCQSFVRLSRLPCSVTIQLFNITPTLNLHPECFIDHPEHVSKHTATSSQHPKHVRNHITTKQQHSNSPKHPSRHMATIQNMSTTTYEHFSNHTEHVNKHIATSVMTCNAVPGALRSKFTVSEKPYIWIWLFDANVKMY